VFNLIVKFSFSGVEKQDEELMRDYEVNFSKKLSPEEIDDAFITLCERLNEDMERVNPGSREVNVNVRILSRMYSENEAKPRLYNKNSIEISRVVDNSFSESREKDWMDLVINMQKKFECRIFLNDYLLDPNSIELKSESSTFPDIHLVTSFAPDKKKQYEAFCWQFKDTINCLSESQVFCSNVEYRGSDNGVAQWYKSGKTPIIIHNDRYGLANEILSQYEDQFKIVQSKNSFLVLRQYLLTLKNDPGINWFYREFYFLRAMWKSLFGRGKAT
jgi:hypothetical protein